ncbi:uncharacterized protein THITE_2112315 [Thermothielavioides terrestris NRRL 8126]|uniref:SPT2 chromatin protein n=2 Tax=Thermothielavioides terrestris TaxID=2587410 RepID=G2QYJ9_THETT|nr:uncharacterized protein THITE_2112315 [Thermothielavioides terrestris NRRL 8126]AEO65387.1 hypothetical protein THITE_2112315 [Thermothielavioides terrestris NRRL 8126]
MPILDLLASITGEKPTPSSNPPPRPSTVQPKRKAEDELRSGGLKAARTDSVPEKPSRPSSDSPRPSPRPADRPLGNSSDKPSSKPQSTVSKSATNERPGVASPNVNSTAKMPANGNKTLPSRPVTGNQSAADPAPPKKRSYAEIMARAKANAEQREALGKIHHKTVERSMTMKERKELKAEELRKAKSAARKVVSGRTSASSTLARDTGQASGARDRALSGSTNGKKTAAVEEKKVKKAALATTGYTGTARPRTGAATTARSGAVSRPTTGAESRDRARYGGPLSMSRKRYEEEDDDLDDFIEYDDEEEEQSGYGIGRRYQYDSYDDESDMEAGLSVIEDEELEADRHARREDQEQEALEKRLKREKEERKRKLLQAAKSKTGVR